MGGCRLGLAACNRVDRILRHRIGYPSHLDTGCDRSPWIAAGVQSHALLPIGHPIVRFGPVRCIALAGVVYQDPWGQPYRDL